MSSLKLPEIRGWIDDTLNTHKAQARPVRSYEFKRLPLFYSAKLLRETQVVEVARVPVPPLTRMGFPEFAEFENGDHDGITYRSTYFIKSNQVSEESLHLHELVHVLQWQHLDVDRFLMAYAVGYLKAHGYRWNPLETMAYDIQAYFCHGGSPIDLEPVVRRLLDALRPSLLGVNSESEP